MHPGILLPAALEAANRHPARPRRRAAHKPQPPTHGTPARPRGELMRRLLSIARWMTRSTTPSGT